MLHEIGDSFGVSEPASLAWLVGGYALTVGTFILFSGRLGDVFGYKKMVIIGFVWFSLWSVVAGVSVYSNYTLAVFSRVLQGIGPALCLPNAVACFGVAYPPGHRKAMVFALFGAIAPVGGILGGVFAALFDLAWWPWAMWALAIWLAVLAVASIYAIPALPRHRELPQGGLKVWIQALDIPGAVVGVAALVLFIFSWTQAPIDGWGTATVLVPLILGLVLFGVFMFIEFKISPEPLLPFAAVNIDVAFVLASVVCGWATFGIWTLFLVQIFQDIRGLSPLLSMAWLSPVAVAGAAAAVLTGSMLGPLAVTPPVVMALAMIAFVVGAVLTASAPIDQIYWGQIFVSMIVMPFGMDMSFPAATLTLSNTVAKEHQGIGASLVTTVVNYGIALGVGLAGTVDVHVHGGVDTKQARLDGYRAALWTGAGLGGLGLIIAFVCFARERFHMAKRPAGVEA